MRSRKSIAGFGVGLFLAAVVMAAVPARVDAASRYYRGGFTARSVPRYYGGTVYRGRSYAVYPRYYSTARYYAYPRYFGYPRYYAYPRYYSYPRFYSYPGFYAYPPAYYYTYPPAYYYAPPPVYSFGFCW
ncbi:MAG: hypothetical protein HRF43_08055 [Phycisphaerae bacterium]